MEVSMISRGVEISSAGGVAETEDEAETEDVTTVVFFLIFTFFCFYIRY